MEIQEPYVTIEISPHERNRSLNYFGAYNQVDFVKNCADYTYCTTTSEIPYESTHVTDHYTEKSYSFIDNSASGQDQQCNFVSHNGQRKRGRKPKSGKSMSRHENKLNRNSNKRYINYKGIEVQPKEFNDFECKCIKQCNLTLNTEDRKMEFDKFWALSSYDAQTAYIAAKVSEHPVKRRYGQSTMIKKDFSRKYSLSNTMVCRDMFCKTLQISSGRINTALTKLRKKTSINDQRGTKKFVFDLPVINNCNRISGLDNVPKVDKNSLTLGRSLQDFSKQHRTLDGACAVSVANVTSSENKNFNNSNNFQHNGSFDSISVPSKQYAILESQNTSEMNYENTYKVLPYMSKDNTNVTENDNLEKPIKKGRKSKLAQSREENKINRNNNKAYVNYKGVIIEPKKFVDFKCKCSKKCYQMMSKMCRNKEFEKFWTLPYNSQTAYIVAAVSERPVKRRYAQQNEPKKDYSRKYALGMFTVCRDMFCRTLHISPGRINTALKKYRTKSSLTDQRGIKQGGHNKLPAEKRIGVIRFMKRIPVYKSHFSREKNKAKFLPLDTSSSKLYEMYKAEEKDNAVSIASFKKMFYSSFHFRVKETCSNCEMLKNQLKKELNQTKRLHLQKSYGDHLTVAQKAQKYLEHDLLLAKKYPDVECITFDMEKLFNLPHIQSNVSCFKRLLWLYNLGIYSSKNDQAYCYVWAESQAGKGAQEVGSCILKHAKEELIWSPEISHIILWTDACGGLNRNFKLLLMLNWLLQTSRTIRTIKLKFLIPGHNNLPNQRDFCDIERALKCQNSLYLPEDYVNVMKHCRKKKPIVIKSMSTQDFLSTKEIEKYILNINIKSDKQELHWTEIQEISMFIHDPYTAYLKTDFDGESFTVDLRPRTDIINNFMHSLVPLWPLGKPITSAKLKDLKSMLHLVPSYAKAFYANLQCGSNNDQDVDGLNEYLDFDIEHYIK